ncbi:MAG: dihydroorotate dehydrogenase [Candidatus Cloacimonadaceae bacterium]|jgi:dihydroorotate dehydrogenase (NAD+) catalytic subunit|nr:dihydroorotate dehydrogenase [Candidatus Cloacimonadota bacterium]MCB5258663.1 dihydroorotate dehydrogenase [Candidatus Cloacimonadota bacterium]MDD5625267.1 dihydroorotate dehydrogenase [Candidatus Cloacimonadota bacterium]MDY0111967.1 dihydroorotate dehydrogenase [Candidatus Syntrophosphaera sp.]
MNDISTSLGKITLKSPILNASGTFGTEYFNFFEQEVLGAYVTKTITLKPKEGNPSPRLYETETGLLNAIGLQNPGLKSFLNNDLFELKDCLTIPLIVSFSGATEDEFIRVMEALELHSGICGYEINISCPNVKNEGIAFGTDSDIVFNLVERLAELTERELIVKLSPNVADIALIAQAAEAGGASALSLINTLYGMAIDWETGKSRLSTPVCGYSGMGIKPVALALTYQTTRAVKIPVIAMGGIHSWQDALEFFYAGASAIAIGTANFSNPLTIPEIHHGLQTFLKQHNLNLRDIIGKVN